MQFCPSNTRPLISTVRFLFVLLLTAFLYRPAVSYATTDGYRIEPEPAWVVNTEFDSAKGAEFEGAVSYQLLDKQTFFDGNQANRFKRLVMKINNTSGLEKVAETKIHFDPSYQQLRLHKFNIIRNNQVLDKLESARISLAKTESESDNNLLNGEMAALIILRDVRVGDQLDYSFTIVGSNPVFSGGFSEMVKSGWNARVGQFDYRVSSPISKTIHYKLKHMPVPETTVNNGFKQLHWTLKNTEIFEHEDDTPSWYYNNPEIQLSSYGSWDEVAEWGKRLFSDRSLHSDKLQSLISELKGLPKEEQIVRALDFTQQNIRYFGIEVGVNSHLPHSPVEVAELGYGDCKDKTLLLTSILQALDIKAYPALVHTRLKSELRNYQPSHGWFNHVITLVELNDKQYWLDPTMSSERGGLDARRASNLGTALVLGHENKLLETIPAKRTQLASVDVKEKIFFGYQHTPVRYHITTVYRRGAANGLRRRLQSEGRVSIQKNYLEYMQGYYEETRLAADTRFTDHEDRNEIVVEEQYLIDDLLEVDKNRFEFNLYKYAFRGRLTNPSSGAREMPLYIPGPEKWRQHTTVVYPFAFSLDLEGDSSEVVFKTDSLSYSSTESSVGRYTMIDSELVTHSDYINADDFRQYKDFRDNVNDQLSLIYNFYISTDSAEISDLMNESLVQLNADKRTVSLK